MVKKLGRPRIDLSGKTFNRWTAIKYDHSDSRDTFYLCKCQCGVKKVLRASYLKSVATSCGCMTKDRVLSLVGKVFSSWTVIELLNDGATNVNYLCRCECGTEAAVRSGDLKNGASRSCGCKKSYVRTLSLFTLRRRWQGMIQRCDNPKHVGYKNYGGRGISVCSAWYDFDRFHKDMGFPPTVKHSIERKNNDGQYSKANCKWATWKEQAANRQKKHGLSDQESR